MSRIEGIEQFKAKLRRFEDEVTSGIDPLIEAEVRAMQQEAAANVPVDSGEGRAALLDSLSFRVVKSPDGPGRRVIYGLDVPALGRRAFHLFFVEFGTKGYAKKSERTAGFDKKGRRRWKKVKRAVPPRPAQPFWRPAEAQLWRRLENKLNMMRIVSAAKRAAGFASAD